MEKEIETLHKYFTVTFNQYNSDNNYLYSTYINGVGEYQLRYKTNDLYDANLFLEKLYNKHNFCNHITFKKFYEYIIEAIYYNHKNIQVIKNKIINPKKFIIFKEIFGVEVVESASFGDFTIYNLDKCREFLEKKYENYSEKFKNLEKNIYLIKTEYESSKGEVALANADIKINEFINSLYYIYDSQYINPTCNKYESTSLVNFAFSENTYCEVSTSKLQTSINLDLIISKMQDNEILTKLIKIITSTSNNELENLIKDAVNWIGESIKDNNPSTSLLKAVISLETLLSFSEGQITPSIMHTICEASAFILGNDFETRLKIEKNIKKIYSTRSSITHSGKKEKIINIEKKYIISIVKSIINTLLSDKFLDCKNKKELMDKIKKIKYGTL